jgi:hypothetical protein
MDGAPLVGQWLSAGRRLRRSGRRTAVLLPCRREE